MNYQDLVNSLKPGQQIIKTPMELAVVYSDTETRTYIVIDGCGTLLEINGHIPSSPPTGKCKVTNLYVDPTTGKLVVQYDDTPIN